MGRPGCLLLLSLESLPAVVEIVDAIDAGNGIGRNVDVVLLVVAAHRCCCGMVVHAKVTRVTASNHSDDTMQMVVVVTLDVVRNAAGVLIILIRNTGISLQIDVYCRFCEST